MGAADSFLAGLIEDKLLSLHTSMPCKVISYDEGSAKAVVQPLFKAKEVGKEARALPLIQNVPVLKQRLKIGTGEPQEYIPVYQAGDIVFVAFSERSLDAVLAGGGSVVLPDSTRHHSLNDAVIQGVLVL